MQGLDSELRQEDLEIEDRLEGGSQHPIEAGVDHTESVSVTQGENDVQAQGVESEHSSVNIEEEKKTETKPKLARNLFENDLQKFKPAPVSIIDNKKASLVFI